MGYEFERRFLVNPESNIDEILFSSQFTRISQGYFEHTKDSSGICRVRKTKTEGYITVKFGKTKHEFEYEIPVKDADEMLRMLPARVDKHRYFINRDHLLWEIDVFDDFDFIIAEVELPSMDYPIDIPEFCFIEITEGYPEFSNYNLAFNPKTANAKYKEIMYASN